MDLPSALGPAIWRQEGIGSLMHLSVLLLFTLFLVSGHIFYVPQVNGGEDALGNGVLFVVGRGSLGSSGEPLEVFFREVIWIHPGVAGHSNNFISLTMRLISSLSHNTIKSPLYGKDALPLLLPSRPQSFLLRLITRPYSSP